MSLNKPTWLVISAIALFCILYFGFSIVSKNREQVDLQRSMVAESVSISTLLKNAKSELNKDQLESIEAFEFQLEKTTEGEKRIDLLEELASRWYRLSRPEISGYYAERIAERLETDPDAWSIAGTTYTICLQQNTEDEKVRSFCGLRARKAFENAISLEPEVVSHRLNLAVAYTEFPSEENPMQGILMLRELVEQYPNHTGVLFNLGRFALQTGQYDRAIERLEKAHELDPNSAIIACLLGQAYDGSGNKEAAQPYLMFCN